MITLNYGEIGNPKFNSALTKIDSFTGFPKDKLYSWNKLKAQVDSAHATAQNAVNRLIKKHGEKEPIYDTVGNKRVARRSAKTGSVLTVPKTDDKGHAIIKDQEAYDNDFEETMNTEFTVKVHKFTFDDLAPIKLTPAEFRAIVPLLEDGDEEWNPTIEDQESIISEDPSMVANDIEIKQPSIVKP